jgi:hypothetical protein
MNSTELNTENVYLKNIAKGISYIFHPLFIPLYIFLTVLYFVPYEFSGFNPKSVILRIASVFISTAFFPALVVFLLWKLKFINSIFLNTQKERIIPYITTMIFYWWMFYLSKNLTDQPSILKVFFLGIFITTAIAVIANNYFKISMHGLGVGGATAFLFIFSYAYEIQIGFYLSIALLISGVVLTSRLLISNHSKFEVYTGFIVACICQIISAFVIL